MSEPRKPMTLHRPACDAHAGREDRHAHLLDLDVGVGLLLVGDSLGMALQGHESTVHVMEQIPALLFDGAEGMTFEQFFLKLFNTTPATRSMVETTPLKLHRGGEFVAADEFGDRTKARINLKSSHAFRLPT